MVITQPTVDDFSDTTVMRVIRKIVNYICNDLVDGINNNDIVSGQFSVKGNQLSGTLTKGDGTTIDIPAATLPSGGGSDNPYPTAVSMTLSDTILNFSMTMSSGSPITASVDLSSIAGGGDTVILTMSNNGHITSGDTQRGVAYELNIANNTLTLVGSNVVNGIKYSIFNDAVQVIQSVSGQVIDGNLKITVNGVESGDIPLPESNIDTSKVEGTWSDTEVGLIKYNTFMSISIRQTGSSVRYYEINRSIISTYGIILPDITTIKTKNENITKCKTFDYSGSEKELTITSITESSDVIRFNLSSSIGTGTMGCMLIQL